MVCFLASLPTLHPLPCAVLAEAWLAHRSQAALHWAMHWGEAPGLGLCSSSHGLDPCWWAWAVSRAPRLSWELGKEVTGVYPPSGVPRPTGKESHTHESWNYTVEQHTGAGTPGSGGLVEKMVFEVDLNGGWGLTGLCVSVCRLPPQAGELGGGCRLYRGSLRQSSWASACVGCSPWSLRVSGTAGWERVKWKAH